jgi:hypothetical protein
MSEHEVDPTADMLEGNDIGAQVEFHAMDHSSPSLPEFVTDHPSDSLDYDKAKVVRLNRKVGR